MPRRAHSIPHELAMVFNDAHRHGTAALQAGDLKGFGHAIAVERSLIQEQHENIVEQRATIDRLSSLVRRDRRSIQPKGKRRRSRANSR